MKLSKTKWMLIAVILASGVLTLGGREASGQVESRIIFYNNSSFDANDPAPDASDDNAIAPDKTALLPGGAASGNNYTSYDKGINGLMVDIHNLPNEVSFDDFEFRVGNSNDTLTWGPAVTPVVITTRMDQGVNGADRVTVIWQDRAIVNQWLEVTVKAGPNTGLSHDDVFYIGNGVAESGDTPGRTLVSGADMLAARNHPTGPGLAPIDSPYDYNRDGRVHQVDMLLARENVAVFDALRLISVPWFDPPAPVGSPRIPVGDHVLEGNTPGQKITLRALGGEPVQGMDLFIQIGDGGAELGGTPAPSITDVDLTPLGGIFSGLSYPQVDAVQLPQACASFIILDEATASVPAYGVVAELTIDTAGFTEGVWDLQLWGVMPGPNGLHYTDFAGVPVDIMNGLIIVVPEPATLIVLMAGGLPLLLKRRKRGACK